MNNHVFSALFAADNRFSAIANTIKADRLMDNPGPNDSCRSVILFQSRHALWQFWKSNANHTVPGDDRLKLCKWHFVTPGRAKRHHHISQISCAIINLNFRIGTYVKPEFG
jgi:hypothetical protein